MNRNWLELVFPAALGLLVVTIGVFLMSMTGLLHEEPLSLENDVVELAGDSLRAAPRPATIPLPPGTDPAAVAAGDALFKGNCAQCHAINDVVVGPALAGLAKRRSESWLIPWVKNSSKVVASGDEYAVKIYNQYQKQQMPSFQLSDDEIRQILLYVRSQEGAASAAGPGLVVVD
ncbi:c-type cytochrome [Hymenobacter canadensis]|uniref:Cytochrome c n=1 Tax=Hymenobacter canadensis TaxID=2999067 RepID=A0ABY7LSM0_9BACT|nr:cytochrome c [Hymenobacter canadensis]WBA42466.1 cytochrome c [Hymenobacter canadensis]